MPSFLEITKDFLELGKELEMETSQLSNGAPVLFKNGKKILSILSGMHGDEKAGPLFLHCLLQKFIDQKRQMPDGILIIPILNDDGWDKNSRYYNGIDLNRQFESTTKPHIIEELIQIYGNKNIKIHWDAHEDDTCNTEYIFGYEHNIILPKALSEYLKCNLITWSNEEKEDAGSSESYMAKLGIETTTTETPPTWDLIRRIEWNEKIFEWLAKRHTSGN